MKPILLKTKLLTLALIAAGAVAPALFVDAANPAAARASHAHLAYNVPDPAAQLKDSARRFRQGDLAGLLQSLVPPTRWEEVRTVYELQRFEPIPEKDREEFARKLADFTAPDAVDRIMAELQPKMEQARPQVPGALLMAFGAMQMAANSPESELTPSQREALVSVMPGLQTWMSDTDFLNEKTLRQALTLLSNGVRNTGITDIEQLRDLPLEAALDRGRIVLDAGKQAARLYGIDLDAVADSLRVEVLELDAETATVRSTVTLFGAPVWIDHELVLVDGRWVGKEMARHMRHEIRIDADFDAEAEAEAES